MTRYLIRRGIGAVIVMWAVATLVFFIVRLVPGDPIAAIDHVGDVVADNHLRGRGACRSRTRPAACPEQNQPGDAALSGG